MNWIAIFKGLVTFVVLYFAHSLLVNMLQGDSGSETFKSYAIPFAVVSWIIYVIPGYVSGKIAQKRGIIHGVITGLLIGVSTLILQFVIAGTELFSSEYIMTAYFIPVWAMFMCGLGGGLGQLHAKRALEA